MLGTFGLVERVHRMLDQHSFALLQNTQYMALLIDELSRGLHHYLSENTQNLYTIINSGG